MKKIHVNDENKNLTLLELIAEQGEGQIAAPCGGKGKCGKCKVHVEGLGQVLACQIKVGDIDEIVRDGCLEISTSEVSVLTTLRTAKSTVERTAEEGKSFALAFDIGTTTVVGYLVNKTGEILASEGQLNAQSIYGADVISRITACQQGKLEDLSGLIHKQLREIADKLCISQGISFEQVEKLSAVGNTVMCHLLAGLSPESIGIAPFEPVSKFGDSRRLFSRETYIAPAVAGYVGGDITAGLLWIEKIRQMNQERGSFLLVDLGTNGEMALFDGEKYICAAVAAGPAFEGAEISMGMMAAEGAIDSVWFDNGIKFHVIGEVEPVGICGSGLLDLLAVLVREGFVNDMGLLENDMDKIELGKVTVTQEDIFKLIMAKAAVAAGIKVLMDKSGLASVDKTYLAGGFGSYLDPESARAIGMLPNLKLAGNTVAVGNSAGEGAIILLQEEAQTAIGQLVEKCHYIELANDKTFSEIYIEEMSLGR